MYREILHGNRLCNDKSILRLQKHHADNLTKIHGRKKGSGTLDNRVPDTKKMAHLARNFKKEQMMEERFSDIERENGILLGKMTRIMTHSGMSATFQKDQPSRGDAVPGRSLNVEARQRELARISGSNEKLLARILERKPEFSCKQWEADVAGHKLHLRRLRRVFPLKPVPRGPKSHKFIAYDPDSTFAMAASAEGGAASVSFGGGGRSTGRGTLTRRAAAGGGGDRGKGAARRGAEAFDDDGEDDGYGNDDDDDDGYAAAAAAAAAAGAAGGAAAAAMAADGGGGGGGWEVLDARVQRTLQVLSEWGEVVTEAGVALSVARHRGSGALRVAAEREQAPGGDAASFGALELSAAQLSALVPDTETADSVHAYASVRAALLARLEVREVGGTQRLVLPAAAPRVLARRGKRCVVESEGNAGGAGGGGGGGGGGQRAQAYVLLSVWRYAHDLLRVQADETTGTSHELTLSLTEARGCAVGVGSGETEGEMRAIATALLDRVGFVEEDGLLSLTINAS